MAFKLRHYQQGAQRRNHSLILSGSRRILDVAPTGAGKTILACAEIEHFTSHGMKVAFAAHRDELITQPCRALDDYGIPYGVIKAGQPQRDIRAKVHVIGVQTFNARIKFMPRDYDVLIFDESHRSIAPSYLKIIEHCTIEGQSPIVIGLTATPYRTDGRGLGELYTDLVEVSNTQQLIDEGYLVPPLVFRADKPDLSGVPLKNGDYDEDAAAAAMDKPRINGHAVNEYMRLALGRRCIVFCCNRAHGRHVHEAYREAGITAEYLDGETPTTERRAILDRLKSGRTLVVVNVMVLTEGFDEPRVEVVQTLRPTKSRCIWRQASGRGLRPCPEIYKSSCIILDHVGWRDEHGYLTDPDLVTLAGGLSKERPKAVMTCPRCHAALASRPRVCPSCGASLVSEAGEDTIGLGDASVSLVEDAPFFGQWRERPPEPAPAPYVPQRPNMMRVARRSRGL